MTTIDNTPASTHLVFNLSLMMTSEGTLKEIYVKTTVSTLDNKTTLQTIIVVVMSNERICSTVRTVVAATVIEYVTHTLLQYQVLIDRVTHAAYLASVLGGASPDHPDPFDEHLAESVDHLESSFEVFISDKRRNNIYTTGDSTDIVTTYLDREIFPSKGGLTTGCRL